MQNKEGKNFKGKKGAMLVLSLSLVCVAALTTFYTMNRAEKSREEQQELLDLNEDLAENETESTVKSATNDVAENTDDLEAEAVNNADASQIANEMDVDPDSLVEPAYDAASAEVQEETAAVDAASTNIEADIQPTVAFDDGTSMNWPVAGTVLLDYSMDATVYFPTLNQYKYNPALIISAEEGGQVVASAKGIVDSIEIDEETGTTLKLNLGNNYELTYGQLKEVTVSQGDTVEAGTLLGYVSEPTKYYSEEGSNLFFEMTKDGEPVDPFLYLE